jgi:hypothetical protein
LADQQFPLAAILFSKYIFMSISKIIEDTAEPGTSNSDEADRRSRRCEPLVRGWRGGRSFRRIRHPNDAKSDQETSSCGLTSSALAGIYGASGAYRPGA